MNASACRNQKKFTLMAFSGIALLLLALNFFFKDFVSSVFEPKIQLDLLVQMSLMLLFIVLPPVISRIRGRFDFFEVINIYLIVVFLNFFLPSLFFCHQPVQTAQWYQIDFGLLPKSLFLLNLSFFAVLFGYYFPFVPQVSTTVANYDNYPHSRVHRVMLVFAVLFIGASVLERVILGPKTSRGFTYHYGYGIFAPFSQLSTTIPLFYYIYYWTQKKRNIAFLILSIALILIGFKSGSRGAMMMPFALIIVARHYLTQRIKLKELSVFAVILVILVVYVGIYRLESFQRFDANFLLERTGVTLKSTFSGLEMFLTVLTQVPKNIPFFKGQCLGEQFFWPFFPRLLFPFKPSVYGYNLFWEKQFHILGSSSAYFISMPGELYVDFGPLGIFVGSFLIGILLRTFYRWFGKDQTQWRGKVFLYCVALIYIIRNVPLGGVPFVYEFISSCMLPLMAVGYIYGKSQGCFFNIKK